MTTIDPVELTRLLVRFDTPNPPGEQAACARFLAEMLGDHGFQPEIQEYGTGRVNIVAKAGAKGSAKPPLCFTGHLDTVPVGNAPWRDDPFAGVINDGLMYGRGTSDMKAGIAAFVAAASAEMDFIREECPVSLVITADEETGCQGALALMRAGRVEAFSALIVAEPTSNMPFLGHKGALWMNARTRGVAAHGSMPASGVNAIYKAAHAIGLIEKMAIRAARHPVLGEPTINVGRINGGANINSVPDFCEFSLDIRSVQGITHRELIHQLETVLGADVSLETLIDLPSVWTNATNGWTAKVREFVARHIGRPVHDLGAPYFTDASVLQEASPAAPILILGPGEAAMAHKTDEYCRVDNILAATGIYRGIIRLSSSV